MKRPESIILLGHDVKVVYKPILDDNESELYGCYSEVKKTIYISEDQTPDEMMITLLHECMHAIVKLTAHDENFSEKNEEIICKLVENLAPIVYLRTTSDKINYEEV